MDVANAKPEVPPNTTRPGTPRGTVELILGCMFSGKTTLLLDRIRAAGTQGVCSFKHALDRRYRPDRIVAHHGDTVACRAVAASGEIARGVPRGTVFCAIDEAHFFDEGLAEVVDRLAGMSVCVCLTGLDLDSWGRPFGVVEALRRGATQVSRQFAACGRCGAPADHTQRLTPIVGSNLVGGPESYEPRCAACWQRPPEAPPD